MVTKVSCAHGSLMNSTVPRVVGARGLLIKFVLWLVIGVLSLGLVLPLPNADFNNLGFSAALMIGVGLMIVGVASLQAIVREPMATQKCVAQSILLTWISRSTSKQMLCLSWFLQTVRSI